MTTTPLPEPEEQAAFEKWLYATLPSGDAEDVQHQWEESTEYQEYLDSLKYTADQLRAYATAECAARDAEIERLKETVFQLNRALREATEAPTFMGEPVSLLRKPIKSLSELTMCYCPPGKCGAPVIMGRQTPCIRERAALKENNP